MGFEGSLEDLSVVDVLQLLHVSKKSGALRIFSATREAAIDIKDGHIVGCRHPSRTMNVGSVLMAMDAASEADIDDAVAQQQAAGLDSPPGDRIFW